MMLNINKSLCKKIKYSLFLLFHYTAVLISQTPGKIEYAPVGAKWVYELGYNYPYDWYLYGYRGYIEYSVQKDTHVMVGNQNILCKKIIVSDYMFNWNNSIFYEYLPFTCYGKYTLTFKRNDTIFWMVNSNDKSNKFYPIVVHYNQTGPLSNFWYFTSLCWYSQYFNQPFSISTLPYNTNDYVPLQDIDTIFVFNDTIRKYKYHSPYLNYPITYLENIGFLGDGLIPLGSTEKFIDNTISVYNLRCYYDPVNGWINFIMGNCYHTKPGTINVPENLIKSTGFYYSNKKIYFRNGMFPVPSELKIYDVFGKKIFDSPIENSEPVELNLNSGIYLIEINRKILKFMVE